MIKTELNLILPSLFEDHLGFALFILGIFIMGIGRQYVVNVKDQKTYPFTELQYQKLFLSTALFLKTDTSFLPEELRIRLKRVVLLFRGGLLIALIGITILTVR